MSTSHPTLCAIGDVHGHLQLGLAVAARWQRELGIRFEAVLLCGDIGSFTDDRQLDSTTRRRRWTAMPDGQLIAPELARATW